MTGQRTSEPARHAADDGPIRGVGLSMPGWAEQPGAIERLSASMSWPLWSLSAEFPHVRWALMAEPPDDAVLIRVRAWRAAPADFPCWDTALSSLSGPARWIVVDGDDADALEQTVREVVTRYQRLLPRTNLHSATDTFGAVLRGHRAMHDLSKPLVRADYDHALDVWQWVLRLTPTAGLALQLAALFHDVERLVSEADRRIEHTAPDYQAFKDAHAEHGAGMAAEVLAACGVELGTCTQVADLICQHEVPSHALRSADLELLANADALSFFSLNSSGFADYYGAEHTRKKVRYSLGRMTSHAIARLADMRLREDVAALLAEAVRGEARTALAQVGT